MINYQTIIDTPTTILPKTGAYCFLKSNGNKLWVVDNQLHREDGPAVEWANGEKEWCIKGLLHREDGPARISLNSNGTYYDEWFLYGTQYSEKDYKIEMRKYWKEALDEGRISPREALLRLL